MVYECTKVVHLYVRVLVDAENAREAKLKARQAAPGTMAITPCQGSESAWYVRQAKSGDAPVEANIIEATRLYVREEV